MKLTISGYGSIGKYLIENLGSFPNVSIILIEKDEEKIQEAKDKHDILVIEGDVLSYHVLNDANVDNCDLFIACTRDDNVNIISCQLAKKMGARYCASRVHYDLFTPYEKISELENYFGIDWIICSSVLTAWQIINYVLAEKNTFFESYFSNKLDVVKIEIQKKSKFVNQKLEKLKNNFKVIACYRGEKLLKNTNQIVLKEGDSVILAEKKGKVQRNISIFYGDDFKKTKNIYIAGYSVEMLTVIDLLTSKGKKVTFFSKNRKRCEEVYSRFDVTVIHKDVTEHATLDEEEIKNCRAFICGSDDDADNLAFALNIENHDLSNIIILVQDSDKVKLFERFQFKKVISLSEIISKGIQKYFNTIIKQDFSFIQGTNIRGVVKVISKESTLVGNELSEYLKKNKYGKIVAVYRRGEVLLEDKIFSNVEIGDKVLIVCLEGKGENIVKVLNHQ